MLKYVWVTVYVSVLSLILALGFALVISVSIELEVPVLSRVSKVWKSIFRGTPLLAQLFWICYGLPQIIEPLKYVPIEILLIAGMSFNASSYMAESLRGAVLSIDSGQMEACLSSGMTAFQGMRRIVLPQAFRVAVPALSNNFVDIIKQSSLAFTLGIKEIMSVAKMEGASAHKFLEAFTAVMIVYWLVIFAVNCLQKLLEKRLNRIEG